MDSNKASKEKAVHDSASLTPENPLSENHCEKCYEPLIFAMKDNDNEFSLGLKTILECLQLAETEGYVPSLPASWWQELDSQYKL